MDVNGKDYPIYYGKEKPGLKPPTSEGLSDEWAAGK